MLRKWGTKVRSSVAASAFLLCACGGAQKETNSPAGEESATGSDLSKDAGAARTLEPAPAPSGVVAKLRLKDGGRMVDSVVKSARGPANWRNLLEENTKEFPWAKAIDWEGTIEAVVAMNVKNPQAPHAAFSVGVRALSPVLTLLEKNAVSTLEGPGEVYYFQISGDDCAVGPSLGSSPARVVCASERNSLDLLLLYALRGLPTERLSEANLHMEFEMEPLRAAYGQELKTLLRWAPAAARSQHQGNRSFDSALSDGAVELAREGTALINELTRVTVQVTEDSGDFTSTLNVELKGEESDVSKILADFSQRQGELPAIFDALPGSASSAGYSREVAKSYSQKWMSIVSDLLRGAAEMEGASPAFAKNLGSVIKQLGPDGATGVYARGPLIVADSGKKAGLRSAWVLSGTTRSKNDVVQLFDDIAWLMASPDLKTLMADAPGLPQVKRKNVAISGLPGAVVYEWQLPPELVAVAKVAGAQVSADDEMAEVLDSVQRFQTGLIAVQQIGAHTWISWGQTKEELAESFGALTHKDAKPLGEMGDLGGIRTEPAVSAGFSRLDALVGMASFLFPQTILDDWSYFERALPHQGKVPVRYSFQVSQETGTTATWKVEIPSEFIQDVGVFAEHIEEKYRASKKQRSP